MASEWGKRTNYTLGHVVVNPRLGKQWYICTKAGRSGNTNPFNRYTDADGATITDYQVNWRCVTDGGVGNVKFTYLTHKAILTGANLDIKWTYGNPNMKITRRSGTKNGPRSAVYYVGEEVLQISGVLDGPGAIADKTAFKDLFKHRFGTAMITLTLTGDAGASWGYSLNVMHSGANSIRITPLRGHRWMSLVDIQLIVVDNS